MTLEINNVAVAVLPLGFEKMIEADLVEGGRRSVGRNMATDPRLGTIGPHHHGHGVPANDRFDPPLDRPVSRIWNFVPLGDGVDIRRVGGKRQAHPGLLRVAVHPFQQMAHPFGPFVLQNGDQRFDPLLKFNIDLRIYPLKNWHSVQFLIY